MKIAITLLFVLTLTNGCTTSDDFATAFTSCMDHFDDKYDRWEKPYQDEREHDYFIYCASLSRKMVRKYGLPVSFDNHPE